MESDFREADVPEKDILMLEYAEKLTRDPCGMTRASCVKLKKSGFRDSDILDIVQVVAYYNYVNRLACGLGVELEKYWDDE